MIQLRDNKNMTVDIEMKLWNPYEEKYLSEDISEIFFSSTGYFEKIGDKKYKVEDVVDSVELAVDWYNNWGKSKEDIIDGKYKCLYYEF